MLYERVIEVENATPLRGRINPGQSQHFRGALQATYDDGIRSVRCLHARLSLPRARATDSHSKEYWFYPSFSIHKVNPLMKLVSRGDTTVVDAYLSPILRRYVDQVSSQMKGQIPYPPVHNLMEVGRCSTVSRERQYSIRTQLGHGWGSADESLMAGFDKIISRHGWDFYRCGSLQREYERTFETEIWCCG